MNTISLKLTTILFALNLISCVDKTSDNHPRFQRIFNREIVTKNSLYLYKTGPFNPDGDNYYHNLRSAKCDYSFEDTGEICILKPGQRVIFTKERTIICYTNLSWDLLGSLSWNGKTYPVSYNLGWPENDATWRRIYEDFKIPLP